jgi:hypothetical protein
MHENRRSFISEKLIPFLRTNDSVINILGDAGLFSNFCELMGYNPAEASLVGTAAYRKMMNYLKQIKFKDLRRLVPKPLEAALNIQPDIQVSEEAAEGMGVAPTEIEFKVNSSRRNAQKTSFRVIKALQFSSPITKETVDKIERQTKLIGEFTKDYIYYIQGGEMEYEGGRKRNQFPSIEYGRRFQEQVQEALKEGNLPNLNAQQVKNVETILKLLQKIEKDPIYFMNSIAEGGFNMQKELQGSILNDKDFVANGIVVLDNGKKEKEENNIPEGIKEIFQKTEKKVFGDLNPETEELRDEK